MRVSSKTDYALRTVLDLALREGNGVTKAAFIATSQSIPLKFLEQILLALRSGGVVASRRGARGGYFLAKSPDAISVAEVVRLTEDSLVATSKVKRESGGLGFGVTEDPFSPIWRNIEASIDELLEGVSIADVCKQVTEQRHGAAQDYAI